MSSETEHLQVKRVLTPDNKYREIFFIPAFLEDNQIGVARDPEYERRLMEGDPEIAEALRWGNWNIFTGMAFRDYDPDIHEIPPREFPWKWPKWRAVDWGWAAPFCCLWFARDPDIGRVYAYRELYGSGLTDPQQAAKIIENTPPEEGINITYADPSMWAKKRVDAHVKSAADSYRDQGVILSKADNDRIGGKKRIHNLLAPLPDGGPGLVITTNCVNLRRTFPKLARSKMNPEDIEDDQEDHAYDTLRYGLTNVDAHRSARKRRRSAQKHHPLMGNPLARKIL